MGYMTDVQDETIDFGWNLVLLNYCWSQSSAKKFTFFTVEGFTFFRFHPGMLYGKWAMLLFIPPWPSHTWVRLLTSLYMCVHRSVYPFLLGMSIVSLCNPLGSNPSRQRSPNYSWFFFESTPFLLNLLSTENSNTRSFD